MHEKAAYISGFFYGELRRINETIFLLRLALYNQK